MLTSIFVMIGIAVYILYASAQNRRLSKINKQLNILLNMKQYEIEKEDNNHYPER